MAWYRRGTKLGFDIAAASLRSKITITAPKPPVSIINRPPVSVVNQRATFRRYHAEADPPQQVPMYSRFTRLIGRLTVCAGLAYVALEIGIGMLYGEIETIPFTKRKHFLLCPDYVSREIAGNEFTRMKKDADARGIVLPETHPETVRARMVLKDVIQALTTGLVTEPVFSQSGVELANSHLESLNWEVFVVTDHAINACCLPVGKIVLHIGLLKQCTTNEEVATLIAHEVAHVVGRHMAERFTKNYLIASKRLKYYKFIGRDVADERAIILAQDRPFSQRMETEADHIGLLLMASAGYDPRVAPKVFEKLDKGSGNSGLENYSVTHPSGKTRSKLLREANVMQEAILVYEQVMAGKEVNWNRLLR